MKIVTRFPPSPTGPLHIGGARTALFNWAFARHHGGAFYLRFEDTDRARSSREFEALQLEALEWLGVDSDPIPGFSGIPRQSERMERYREAVDTLLANGHAYRCTCTPDEVEAMRERAREAGQQPKYDGRCRERGVRADTDLPFCVRLSVATDAPAGITRWADLIAGPSGQDIDQIDDFVLQRSDGTPIYHLAVVIDDHDMGVTHVIRGREHITSTVRQLLLYDALGFEIPAFGHVPLLVDEKGRKLSKRESDVSTQSYRDRGFTPEAVRNYICRLGWAHGDTEIFDGETFCELFSLEGVGKSASQVGEDKLLWLNQHYLKTLPADTLVRYARPFLESVAGAQVADTPVLRRLLDLLRERSKTLVDMAERARFALCDEIETDPKAARKHLGPDAKPRLETLRAALAEIPEDAWAEPALDAAFQSAVARTGSSLGQLAQPTRVAVVGSAASPGIYETLEVTGKPRTLARIDAALARIGQGRD